MARTRVDISMYRFRLERIRRITPDASEEAIKVAVGEGLKVLLGIMALHNDTFRLTRGWIMAGNQAGVISMPLPPLRPSRGREGYLKKLDEQVAYWANQVAKWTRFEALYRRQRRTGELYYRTITSQLRKATKNLERAQEEARKAYGSEYAIFFDMEHIVQRNQGRKLSTVRDRVYGGTGQVLRPGGHVFVSLTNHEPHVSIVERNPNMGHPAATAKAFMRATGAYLASKKFVSKVQAADRAA